MLRKPKFQLVWACFLAGISGGLAIGRLGKAFLTAWIPYPVALLGVMGFLLFTWIAVFINLRKSISLPDMQLRTTFWQDAIRYFLALNLVMAGLQKFFHLQFDVPQHVLDIPLSKLSGEVLVSSFFSYSYGYFTTIGALQIFGSLLLIYRRTQLFGAVVLLPVLLNIQLINFFYHINTGMQVHITLLVIINVYLLLLEYDRLSAFFFELQQLKPQYNFKSNLIKNVMRYSVVYIPLALLAVYNRYPRNYPEIMGKYNVTKVISNKVRPLVSASVCDSVLTTVYINSYAIVFEYNSYKRRLIGDYKYDKATHNITAVWGNTLSLKKDTLYAHITVKSNNLKILDGYMGKEHFHIELQRVSPKK